MTSQAPLSILTELNDRITEIEWHAKQHHFNVEPHLYPKNLFSAQTSPVSRFKISSYINELRSDLTKLEQSNSKLAAQSRANQLLQKINVLINSFRSQYLRKKKTSSVESFLRNIDAEKDNAYEVIANQNQPSSKEKLAARAKQLKVDQQHLSKTLQSKQAQLEQITDTNQAQSINLSLLEIKKQIGMIERQLTELMEKYQSKN